MSRLIGINFKNGASTVKLSIQRPYEAKKQKKSIGSLWKQVVLDIDNGILSDKGTRTQLLEHCRQYAEGAEASWSGLWQECVGGIEQCLLAAKNGDFNSAQQAVQQVKIRMKSCHKMHK